MTLVSWSRRSQGSRVNQVVELTGIHTIYIWMVIRDDDSLNEPLYVALVIIFSLWTSATRRGVGELGVPPHCGWLSVGFVL